MEVNFASKKTYQKTVKPLFPDLNKVWNHYDIATMIINRIVKFFFIDLGYAILIPKVRMLA